MAQRVGGREPMQPKPVREAQSRLEMCIRDSPYFFAARIFAHLFRCAAAIFLRAEADIVCFTGVEPAVLATPAAGFDPLRTFAHRAFCASAIFRREAAEIIRFGWVVVRVAPEPCNDSIAEIACPNLSTSNCALPCSARSC